MKIAEKYIVAEFLKLLAMALAGFVVLFIMVDLFENMDNLMKYNVPFLASFIFFVYKIPFIIGQVLPVAVLVAVLVSLGILSKHNEVTAMKAGGVPLLKAMRPLFTTGLAISLGVILMNEYVTPSAQRKVDSFKKQWFGEHGGSFSKEGLWLKTSEGILNVRQVDFQNDKLLGLTYYVIEKPFTVRKRIASRTASWQDGRWIAENATVWTFQPDGEADKASSEKLPLEGITNPDELTALESFQQDMSFGELMDYVNELESEGYEATKYKIDLWSKLSFPFVNFIMVMVGIPFALKTGRYSGIATGIGLSIAIGFSYWIIYALTRSLGQSALIPPILAASFPDFLFLAIGALMLGYVKQ